MRPRPLRMNASSSAGSLRVVASARVAPRGPGFDPRALVRAPRALRGGDDGIAVSFVWRAGALRIDVLARGAEPSSDDVARAIETARALSAVDDDPTEFYAMVRRHAVLGKLARAVDVRIGKSPTVFESFAVAVIEQLVTGAESRASIRRLWRQAGEPIPGTELRAAPTAASVRRVPMWRMHELGIGARRAATLREGALRGDALERLASLEPEIAMGKLQSISGVGPWTANHVARHAFGWADAVPVGDFHAPRVVTKALTGVEGGDAELIEVLEPFRPHRARVAILFERAHVAGSLPNVGRWRPPRVDPHRREPWRY